MRSRNPYWFCLQAEQEVSGSLDPFLAFSESPSGRSQDRQIVFSELNLGGISLSTCIKSGTEP